MNLGMGEIALLIALALVLFGAKRLPEVGRAAGSAIREFKSAINATDHNETGANKTEHPQTEPSGAHEGREDKNA
jgi:sec-independent protein translocase protein TatA